VIVSPYLLVEDVAIRLRCSTRTIHELTRTKRIPHGRLPGSRRCLFLGDELERWEAGATLNVRNLEGGGRVSHPHDGRGARTPRIGGSRVPRSPGP
jgi:excisionase family DNA binding protein